MRLFVYSDTGHMGVSAYIHNLGGQICSTDPDPNGGVITCIVNGDLPTYSFLKSSTPLDVFPLGLDTVIPDDLVAKLSAHTSFGIKKGDTVRTALTKIRDARGGDPNFDPDFPL